MEHFLDTVETIPEGFGFPALGITHLCWLAALGAFIVGSVMAYQGLDMARRQKMRRLYALLLLANELFKMVCLTIGGNYLVKYLPLHLCSLNALALPIAVFTKNKILNNTLLLWCFGALFALVLNNSVAEAELFSDVFIFYYFPHVLELAIPILMFALGLAKKDVRCIFSTLGITFLLYTVIHFINLWVNAYAVKNNIVDWAGNVIKVNYMFSLRPENPLLDLFYKIIPHPYWYMYLSAILMVIVLGLVYLKDIITLIKKTVK